MMNRQIDPCKSKYVVSFDPGSRLTLDSVHDTKIQPLPEDTAQSD